MSEQSGGSAPQDVPSSSRVANTPKKKKGNSEHLRRSTYPGKIDELKGHVYNVGYNSRDQFASTTKEIGENISRTYKGAGEFLNAFDPSALGFDPIVYPIDPDPNAKSGRQDSRKLPIRKGYG